jgi:hypothetical protein
MRINEKWRNEKGEMRNGKFEKRKRDEYLAKRQLRIRVRETRDL